HQPVAAQMSEWLVPAPESSGSALSPEGRRMLEAIDSLPEEEREVFELVRVQGLSHPEAAGVLGVSPKTVQRRLNRSLLLPAKELDPLRPSEGAARDDRRPARGATAGGASRVGRQPRGGVSLVPRAAAASPRRPGAAAAAGA